MKNNEKPGTTAVKKNKSTNDVEYSGNLTPSTSRLKEAGYDKSMDLELAEVGQTQVTENQINNTRSDMGNMENTTELNPFTTITRSNNEQTHHNFEFGEMDTQNSSGNNPNNPEFTTGTAGEPAGNPESDAINENGEQDSSNFEFGNMNNPDKKNKLPAPKDL